MKVSIRRYVLFFMILHCGHGKAMAQLWLSYDNFSIRLAGTTLGSSWDRLWICAEVNTTSQRFRTAYVSSIVCDELYNNCMLSYIFRFLNIPQTPLLWLICCRINTAETTAFLIAVNAERETVLFWFPHQLHVHHESAPHQGNMQSSFLPINIISYIQDMRNIKKTENANPTSPSSDSVQKRRGLHTRNSKRSSTLIKRDTWFFWLSGFYEDALK